MKTAIKFIIGAVAAWSLCMICSDPAEGITTAQYASHELLWLAILVADAFVTKALVRRNVIKF